MVACINNKDSKLKAIQPYLSLNRTQATFIIE
jgi:hypothetical protein